MKCQNAALLWGVIPGCWFLLELIGVREELDCCQLHSACVCIALIFVLFVWQQNKLHLFSLWRLLSYDVERTPCHLLDLTNELCYFHKVWLDFYQGLQKSRLKLHILPSLNPLNPKAASPMVTFWLGRATRPYPLCFRLSILRNSKCSNKVTLFSASTSLKDKLHKIWIRNV